MRKGSTRMLPVNLTEDEVAVKAQELAKKLYEYDVTEEEKKARTKDLTDKMKDLRSEAKGLRVQVSTRRADKMVDCWQEPNLRKRIWEVRRADTNEIVETFAMTSAEIDEARQLDLERYPHAAIEETTSA